MIEQLDCEKYLNTVKEKAKKYIEDNNIKPKLIIFNPSDDEANQIYVRNKKKHLEDVGIEVIVENERPYLCYNLNNEVTPCLVQKTDLFESDLGIIGKNYNLFDIEYIGNPNMTHLVPTPNGVVNMLKRQYNIDFAGKKCVIINRSEIIGLPLFKRLLDENACITMHHSKTNELHLIGDCYNADVIFSGVGKSKFIDRSLTNMHKKQIIIDFGINKDDNGKLCGDVDFESLSDRFLSNFISITPTPKGTGLTTIAQLIENVVEFYGNKPLWRD